MQQPWIVVLAGGEGTRLQSLTRALYGADLPKQFAVLVGDRSLLQLTVERAELLTTRDRILVIVSEHRAAIARDQLAPYRGVELVVQPRALDTGPGLLLPLARILARDPRGTVAFLPSDHYLADTQPLIDALRTPAVDRVSLIGVAPTGPELEYGWIVPGRRIGRTAAFAVTRFVEKPEEPLAESLFASGALWNTFIQSGAVTTYWDLARRHLPNHALAFEHYATAVDTLAEEHVLEGAYARMQPANFSRDLLAHANELAVIPVSGTGWSDWGSPRRVFESLAGTRHLDDLLARIRAPHTDQLAS
ncbi:MAG: putative Mannose-phosphate guanylyltransferase [Deltaproteobacteria bacterium]|nr:putative Mannose-phosphate guanylyltransferase [Deltaproteobacteria bacterium]